MFKGFTIKARVLTLLGCGACLALALGLTASWGFIASQDAVEQTMRVMQAIRNQTDADMMHDAIRSDVLEARLENNPASETSFTEHSARMARAMDENISLVDSADLRNLVAEARTELNRYSSSARHVIMERRKSEEAAAAAIPDFDIRFKALEEKMEKLSDSLEQSAVDRRQQVDTFLSRMQWAVFGLTFLVAMVLISIGIWLSGFLASLLSRLRGSLAHGIDALQRVSENLSSTSSAIVTNQERQISSITESSETSSLISRTASEAAGHVRDVKGQIQHLDSMLGDAETAVEGLNDHMQQIEGANRRVADIIQVLDSIAFQTNILALNASIEAARAGAVGSGFAVVADEVRSLAQRAGEASGQIRDQVQESLARAEEGTSRLGKVMQLFQASREASLGVARNAQMLEAEASCQADGVLEVSRIMDRISQITTSSAQAAREGSNMAGELKEEVHELDAVFTEVLELVGASDASMPSR